jgi:hypothetical protein
MAYDKKYYIRAGAHSEPASHFLVESIRAHRTAQTPVMRAILRHSEHKSNVIELVILVLNDVAALDTRLSFNPLPRMFDMYRANRFPLLIPAIDRLHPFSMELFHWGNSSQTFGESAVELALSYENQYGGSFNYTQTIDIKNSIGPLTIGNSDAAEIAKATAEIGKEVKELSKTLGKLSSWISPIINKSQNIETDKIDGTPS